MNVGGIIHGYMVTGVANGYVIGKSVTAPNPYVTWKIDHDGKGVSCGHYFNNREDAEWDFCSRAFEWFEDNVNIHMIEDGDDEITGKLKALRTDLRKAARFVDELCAEVDKFKQNRGD